MKSNQEITGTACPPVSFWHNFPDIGIKKWIVVSSVLFVSGLLIGIISPSIAALESLDYLIDIAGGTASLSSFVLFIFYMINNIFKMILSFVFSPLLCILPVLSLIMNGWIISNVGYFIVDIQHYPVGFFIMGILPHGIIEIPALIIGQAAALSLGTMTIAAVFIKEKRTGLFTNLRNNLKYLAIVILLLVFAAGIEAFITPQVLELFE
ncbi:MAG: stage II sporulation protein M [Dehalococcoidales bacterium]|nr:stage II sporulation protein M [Dehalococcoidales bacterium]